MKDIYIHNRKTSIDKSVRLIGQSDFHPIELIIFEQIFKRRSILGIMKK